MHVCSAVSVIQAPEVGQAFLPFHQCSGLISVHVCREQEEQQARREELRKQEQEAELLENHGLCALRGFTKLAAQCDGTDFCIKREHL